jgi:hypothetical protein
MMARYNGIVERPQRAISEAVVAMNIRADVTIALKPEGPRGNRNTDGEMSAQPSLRALVAFGPLGHDPSRLDSAGSPKSHVAFAVRSESE